MDWTVNFGNLLTVGAFILSGAVCVGAVRNQVKSLNERMKSVEGEMKKIVEILVGQAQQDGRMNTLDARLTATNARLDDLRRQTDRSRED